ncbi:uncharacterized protein LOC131882182 [Tigriopus californicus]|uniref:uncharacterized protein LOC131882182 n=1 Tax=Tigriopus californicus TaxID=6832 RepID=UPI0027D9E9CC|nr:uncharacterized protein LOC131882182 [Tigriopus californicus]
MILVIFMYSLTRPLITTKLKLKSFLAQNPKEANNVIWIVDTDNSIQVPLDKGFVMEEGLRLNLRNSEEVLNAIELARHGQQFDGCPTVDGERDSKVFSEALKFEPSVKKILVVLDSYRLNKLLKITLEDGINGRFLYYGCLEDSKTCTDEELEAFFDASNQDRLILVAPEHVSDGIEVEMVLVPEIHDVADTTRYRAKTKLKTAYLNSSAHVELLQQNPTPLFKNEIEDVLRQTTWQIGALGTSGICVYSQLRPFHDLNKKSTVQYYSGMTEFQTKHPRWMNHYGPPKIMKIYRVVQEKSPNSTTSNYPFLLWLQPHDHQVIFLIGVEDSFTSCTSFINVEDVPIVNLFVNNLVPTMGIWRDIFIVEIFRSFFLNIDLETSFDLNRLFTIWSRVSEELKRMHLLNVDERTPFPSSDLRRTLLKRPLHFSMSLQANLSSIVSLLPTFAPNGEIHHWDLIQTLLGWWSPNDGDALANHLLRREFAHHTYMPLDNEARGYDLIGYWDISPDLTTLLTVFSPQRLLQAQIQPDSPFQVEKITSLRMELRTGFFNWMSPAATLSKLNWPLIQLIWLKEMTWLWKRIIKKKFRHGLKKPWSHVISKWHTKSRKVEKKMFKAMGITSIYFGEETQTTAYSVAKELFTKEIVYFEMFNEISLAFIELLIFISQQPKPS